MAKPPRSGTTHKHAGGHKHQQHHHGGRKHNPHGGAKHNPGHPVTPPVHSLKPPRQHKPPAAGKKRQLSAGTLAWCSAEALAMSARLAGHQVDDYHLTALYWSTASDPDEGATIEATVLAAQADGLAGVRPARFRPVTAAARGVIIGVTLDAGPHALTIDGPGVWSWGEWHPWQCFPEPVEEAWAVEWLS